MLIHPKYVVRNIIRHYFDDKLEVCNFTNDDRESHDSSYTSSAEQDAKIKKDLELANLLHMPRMFPYIPINSKPMIRARGSPSILSNLAEMQENEYLCDYVIISADERIVAHKIILAASTEFFRAAFRFGSSSNNAGTSAPDDQTSSSLDLTHLECQPDVLRKVIRSFYTNEIDLCPEHVEDILLLADYLMYPELRDRVETYMVASLDHNTAVLYFQLSIHYKLNTTLIQSHISSMIQAHFHDFFVNQKEVVNVSVDTINNYVQCGFLKHCSPLQVCFFFLSNLETTLENLENSDLQYFSASEANILQLFSLMHEVITKKSSHRITPWCGSVLKFIDEWKAKYSKEIKRTSCFEGCFKNLVMVFEEAKQEHPIDSSKVMDNTGLFTQTSTVNKYNTDLLTQASTVDKKDNDFLTQPSTIDKSNTDLLTQPSAADKNDTGLLTQPSTVGKNDEKPKLSDSVPGSPNSSKILVLVAPSAEMTIRLSKDRLANASPPVAKFPQLEISIYDIEMEIWRSGGLIDLPVVGTMIDKHAWRVAFLDNCLYMFSVMKQLALEYNILEKRWTSLTCKEPFKAHDEDAPVKSVIPVAVAGKLVVLSMSKKSRTDGTHSAQQRFYEMQPGDKSFTLVSVVEDSDMEVPITQWTVSGDTLVSLKAGSMMYRQLSQLQYIHCYNAATRRLSSHKISCTMESGIKMLLRDGCLYLLDNSGWYRSYNLDSGEWTGVTRYPEYTQSVHMDMAGYVYPALSRVTCHSGSSRWQASTAFEPVKARLQELHVGADGELVTLDHTPPPHEFVTAMCAACMDTDKLRTFQQAQFEYSAFSTAVPNLIPMR
ncbi:hypothetical protein EGW08_021462 [Elysia chlorotica]|uniref:BTB domain-containing protein n=1 Tax=Elysia chlorotica TaxID=188477 RepID=A0A3S1AYW3_ELYCH|nr:hypothetical protein EGW08_021462 [Elysia chlorotica]